LFPPSAGRDKFEKTENRTDMPADLKNALLIHPNPVEREAVASWLQRNTMLRIVGQMRDLSSIPALYDLAEMELLIIFDYGFLKLASSFADLARGRSNLRFLVLTANRDISTVQDIICSGVHGCLDLSCETEELYLAINAVLAGHVYYSQQIMFQLAEAYKNPCELSPPAKTAETLSHRELEILNLVTKELSTTQIANNLFISTKTVETHRRNIFRKLGVRNAVGLAKAAIRLGLL
jgi:DNA-binding NarL/FixJ family response regulator